MTRRIAPFFGEYVARTITPRSAIMLLAIRKSTDKQEIIPAQTSVNRSMVRTIGAVSNLNIHFMRTPPLYTHYMDDNVVAQGCGRESLNNFRLP